MTKTIKFSSLVFLLLITSMSFASHKKTQNKTGILLVAFGSSYTETKATFKNIETEVHKSFPDIEIRWAYTSKFIRAKLRKRGENIDSPTLALAKMSEEGFTHIAVQSLHIIPGTEYLSLEQNVDAFRNLPKGIKEIRLGKPLLFSHTDSEQLCNALNKTIPKAIGKDDALIYMGHGTSNSANIYYPAMQYYLWQKNTNHYLATVEGFPSLENVITYLDNKDIKNVFLMPFMTIAGDHARNDMAGDSEDSWKTILTKKGYNVKPILQGMATHKEVIDIWIKHIRTNISSFE